MKIIKYFFAVLILSINFISCKENSSEIISSQPKINKITTSFNNNLHDVNFIDEKTGYIVGDSGLVLKTIDAGESWGKIDVDTKGDFFVIKTLSKNQIFIGGEGLILASFNSGMTWTIHNVSGIILSVAFDINNSNIGFACGYISSFNDEWAAINSTSDNGQSWKLWDDTISRKLGKISSVISLDSNNFLVSTTLTVSFSYGTLGRSIYKLNPTSHKVYNIYSTTNIDIFSIHKITNNLIFMAGSKGTILYSDNKGDTWTEKNSGVSENLYSISEINNYDYYAVGDKGTIISSTNKGANWQKQNSGVDVKLNAICFPSSDYGIIVGDKGTILKIKF